MSESNQCSCTQPVFLDWENQWEPGHTCSYCQAMEYEINSRSEEEVSPLMQRLIFERELECAFKLEERSRLKEKMQKLDLEDLPF